MCIFAFGQAIYVTTIALPDSVVILVFNIILSIQKLT